MNRDNIKRLADQVEYILERKPQTRNSDTRLTIEVWKTFHPDRLIPSVRGDLAIRMEALYFVPSQDSVKRIRAKFNAAGKYLPTDEAVAKKRGINEAVWQAAMAPQSTLF